MCTLYKTAIISFDGYNDKSLLDAHTLYTETLEYTPEEQQMKQIRTAVRIWQIRMKRKANC